MAGNRVEELETTVRELEATVEGLTDELVETKERLRILEEEVDVDDEILEGRPTTTKRAESDGGADGGASADDVNTGEGEGGDNAGSDDDIIVA